MTDPSTAAARPHRARRGEGERLREDIVAAADALLVEKGSMDDVSMRAIASRVGVTPPSIYLHFADKVELFFAVCERRFREFSAAVMDVFDDGADALDQLEQLGRAYIQWALDNPEHYEVLFGGTTELPEGVDPTQLAGRITFDVVVGTIQRGIADGAIRPVDPHSAAVTLWSVVHGFVGLALHERQFLPDVDVLGSCDLVLETAIRGLAVDPMAR